MAAIEIQAARSGVRAPFETDVFYLGPQAERPVYHTSDPARCRMNMVSHTITMHDARGLPGGPTLAREGFQLAAQKLPAVDFENPDEVDGPYLRAMQELIQAELGADRVICDTPIVRRSDPRAFQKPATRVHTDFTPASARQLFAESWDQRLPKEEGLRETADLMARSIDCADPGRRAFARVMAINVWRPITAPPHDFPLGFVAQDSLADGDVRPADILEEQKEGYTYFGELSLCGYNRAHRWHHFSDMTPDEVALFVGYDFARPGGTGVMHAAFSDPAWPGDRPGRGSAEVRVFALFAR
jgi:hypothetical protein